MLFVADQPFDVRVFTALLIVVLAAGAMFVLLSRRWTTHRRHVALQDWADEYGYTLRRQSPMPAPLDLPGALVEFVLTNGSTTLVEFTTSTTPGSRAPNQSSNWHALIRAIDRSSPATGLRPAANATSLLDFFSLSSFPSLLNPERFVLFGTENAAAHDLANSHIPSQLPADVGLLLMENFLLLDFSARPFDELELERIVSLADQLSAQLLSQSNLAPSRSPTP